MSIPGSASPLFLASTAAAGAYDIARSIRFNPADTSSFSRTPSSASNKKTWTWSGWVKRSGLGILSASPSALINALAASNHVFFLAFGADDKLYIHNGVKGSSVASWAVTTEVYRDPSAWYHFVLVVDTTQSTSANRIKLYANNVQQTLNGYSSWDAYPSQNYDSAWNDTSVHKIGYGDDGSSSSSANGYVAEIQCLDGIAASPTDFGELDSNSVWQPIKYAGTYGTNGFHLDFSDTSSDSALGTDSSGAGNNWGVNNLTAISNNWDQSQTWSSSLTSNGTLQNASNAFDGDLATRAQTQNAAPNSTLTFAPSSGVSFTSTLEVYCDQGNSTPTAAWNSNSVSPGQGVWVTVFTGSGTINASYPLVINTNSAAQYATLKGVRLDGKLLVNSGVSNPLPPSAIDALRDSPVNGDSASDTGAGGEITGNYATFNPLFSFGSPSTSEGNLKVVTSSSGVGHIGATIAFPTSGKWYLEVTQDSGTYAIVGVIGTENTLSSSTYLYQYAESYVMYNQSGALMGSNSGSSTGSGATFTNGDCIGIALDMDNQQLRFYKNNTQLGGFNSVTTSKRLVFAVSDHDGSSTTFTLNAGQRAFKYTAPSGYKCLNTANLSDPLIADGSTAFDTKLFTGNASTQSITGLNFSPDLVWTKSRSTTYSHRLYDAVRGANNWLSSNGTDANTSEANTLTSFDANGFSVGAIENSNQTSGGSAVAWTWSAGDNSNKTYAVTVSNPGSGNKYYVDGALQPTLTLAEGSTYKFDQSSGTNSTHPLRFSTTSDGTHGGGSEYTTGVTTSGTPGSAGAYTQIVIAASAPTLYAYCTAHSGMGFQINTSDTAGYTIPAGSYNSASYNQSQTWSSGSTSGTIFSGNFGQVFNGVITSTYSDGNSVYVYQNSATYTFPSALTGTIEVWVRAGSNGASGDNVKVTDGTTVYSTGNITNQTAAYVSINNGNSISGITSITVNSGGSSQAGMVLGAIKLNGRMLVDSGVTPPGENSISSRIQADPSKGFSIVSYTGNATIGATVSHGLNAAPELIIAKTRTQTYDWPVYIKPVGPGKAFYLNSTAAAANSTGIWGNIDPTSSVFTLGGDPQANYSGGSIIAYCFSPVEQYSSFGSYVGNNSADGPFVFTGMRPAFILIRSTGGGNWYLYDTAREESNLTVKRLYPNLSNAEDTGVANSLDIVSNGFKLRHNHGGINSNGVTFIYMAFASHPFKTARAR